MKICWDMLEGVCLMENGFFKKGHVTYVYKEACEKCGNPYLTETPRSSNFCGRSCANSGGNNGMYGRNHTVEAREKISKNKKSPTGSSNPNYKGGIHISGLTAYNTYKDRLELYEEVRKQKGTEILEVKCAYCGSWYAPTLISINNRLAAIDNLGRGESRLYCSTNCKLACPTYGRIKYPRGFKHTTSREVSTYLRQIVLKRDNWTCQICGKTIKEAQLHVHHMDPVAQNPMFQNDADSCVTLCKGCHKMVHSRRGCRYVDLQCKEKAVAQHTVKGCGVS